jgi:hypothetical protein
MCEYVFIIILGVVIFVFGFIMGLVCASPKRRNEPCATMQDVIDREG